MQARERRAAVLLIRRGDPELSGAIAEGMAAGLAMQRAVGQTALDHATLHRGRDADYWETLIVQARYCYGRPPRSPAPLRAVGRLLLMLYGTACYGVSVAWRVIRR